MMGGRVLEHIDNNFKPLDAVQKGEFADVTEDIVYPPAMTN